MLGTTLGHYRVEAETGSGGMGVVYRAVDIHLKRPAAIKVLHAGAIADPERRRRFTQEAQAASALNHPDIVTIYEIGSEGATDFIAMEYVTGRSLAEAIGGRPLPLADVIRFGSRIAGALAAAHHAGIVHRDLKPANVMVTERGGIKLLDFGVAKLLEPSTGETGATQVTQTRTGMVVGTLAYMSPEQAGGDKVDARSDIYSFGLLLHEMITGRRVDPAAPTALDGVPRDLRRIVARCLQQDPERRFQAIDDARLALEEAELTPDAAAATVNFPKRHAARFALAASVAVLAMAGAAWFGWRMKTPPAARTSILTRLTMDGGLTIDPALSPDGKLIAFASDRSGEGNLDIWVRQVAGGEPLRLTSDPSDDREPTFSADGSQIAFRSDRDGGGVYVASALGGGDARRIVDGCRRPRWSPAGTQIVCWAGLNTGFLITKADAPRVFVVDANGGEARRLFPSFAIAAAPAWSADGAQLIFLGRRDANEPSEWWIANADGTSPESSLALKAIAAADLQPGVDGVFSPDAWTAGGRVLFSARVGDATNVWSIKVGRGGTGDTPQQLTAGTSIEVNPTIDGAGALAYAAISNDVDLWSRQLDASGAAGGPAVRLTHDPATDVYPWLSPDGTQLAFGSNRSGSFDVWVRDLASGKDVVAARRYSFPSLPTFTKDGLRLTFHGTPRWRWLSVPVPGTPGARSSTPQVVCDNCESFWDLSADGKWALFGSERDTVINVRDIATGRTVELMRLPGEVAGRFRISPDDRWMAFNDRKSGEIAIYIAPFAAASPIPRDRWIRVTPEGTTVNAATWSADGQVLYYLSDRDGAFCVWGQRLEPANKHPVGEPFPVWHFHEARLAMTRVPMGLRALTVSRDRVVVSIAESAGNVWLAK